MDTQPDPPADGQAPEGGQAPADQEAGTARSAARVPSAADSSTPRDESAHDEAPAAVRPARDVLQSLPRAAPGAAHRNIDETAPDLPEVTEAPAAKETAARETAAKETGAKETAATEEVPQTPRGRKWLWVVATVLGVLLGAGVAIALLAPGYVRGRIEEEARARGMVITFQDADVDSSRLRLEGVKISLAGVPDFAAEAQHIEVDLDEWEPRAVRARGLGMKLVGTNALEQLSAWKTKHPKALAAPLDAEGATVAWHPTKDMDAALSFGEAHVAVGPLKGTLESKQTVFIGRAAGPVHAGWDTEGGGLSVKIRPQGAPLSAISIDIVSEKDASPRERPKVTLVLARTKLAELAAALGLPEGSGGLTAWGEVTLPLPSLEKPAPIDGTVKLAVKGYVPPHPKELNGILFGDVTRVQADFTLAPDFGNAKLSPVQVDAGALSLSGLGDVERDGFDARVALTLKGSIPCGALATSAAVANLGEEWGKLAGGLAAGALRGNVSVVITVDARASDIRSAKIDHSAHPGCKVSVPGLPSIVLR